MPYIHEDFIRDTFLLSKPIVSRENFLLLFNWVLRSEDQIIIVSSSADINLSLCESLRNLIYPFSLERGGYRVNVKD